MGCVATGVKNIYLQVISQLICPHNVLSAGKVIDLSRSFSNN
jgi:hypothetical protein